MYDTKFIVDFGGYKGRKGHIEQNLSAVFLSHTHEDPAWKLSVETHSRFNMREWQEMRFFFRVLYTNHKRYTEHVTIL